MAVRQSLITSRLSGAFGLLVGMSALHFAALPEGTGDKDAAYVAKFLAKYKTVDPAPDFAAYATKDRYDTLFLGDDLKKTIEKQASNDQGALAWGLTYRMASLNTMYRITRDPKYLAANLDCIRAVVALRDDKRGVKLWTGEIATAWGCNIFATERGRAVFTVHTGIIVYTMLDCLLLAKDCPAIQSQLGDEFQQILTAGEEAIAFHNSEWRDGPGKGEGHYISLNQEPSCDGKAQPGNRQSAMGCALWKAWKLTHNPVYRDHAKAIGVYMKNRLTPAPDGAYYWPYWLPVEAVKKPAPPESLQGEDSSHASLTIALAVMLAEDGYVFKKKDMKRLANTVLMGLGRRTDGVIFGDVTGSPASNPDYVASPAFWLPLAQYRPEVRARILPFYLKHIPTPGPYDLALLLRYGKK